MAAHNQHECIGACHDRRAPAITPDTVPPVSDEPAPPAPVPAPLPTAAQRTTAEPAADRVPMPLRVTSDIAWRFLVIAAALGLLLWLIVQLRVVVIPVA